MATLKLDYILLITLLYVLFGIYGYRVSVKSKNNLYKNYWALAPIPVFFYSLIEGFRYARGVDYIHYMERYISTSNISNSKDFAPFDWFNFGLNLIGLPYYGAFIIYSLIFIICVMFFLRDYREVSHYSFLLFLPATLIYSECFVAQFVSFSFVFVALKYALRKDWIKFVFFSIIAVSLHNANAFILIIVVPLIFYNKPFNIYVVISIYMYAFLLFDMNKIGVLVPYLETLKLGNATQIQAYTENADAWFSADALQSGYNQNVITKTANVLFDVSVIITGRKLLDNYKSRSKEKSLILFYNLFAIGAIMFQIFFNFEIMRRIAMEAYLFWFILVAYILFYYKTKRETPTLLKGAVIIIVIYIISFCIKYNFLVENVSFVWDKK